MTVLDRFKVLRGKLWFRRKRIPLLLIPAALIALWWAVPFSIWNSFPFVVCCVACSALGFIIRSRAVGVLAAEKKVDSKETSTSALPPSFPQTGIYARMRYPLYTGDFLIWFGFILYIGVDWFAVGATLLYIFCYLIILSKEEEVMLLKYGDEYRQWCEQVPALVPQRNGGAHQTGRFSFGGMLRYESRNLAGMVLLFLLFGAIKYRMIHLTWGISGTSLLIAGLVLIVFLFGSWMRQRARKKKKRG